MENATKNLPKYANLNPLKLEEIPEALKASVKSKREEPFKVIQTEN